MNCYIFQLKQSKHYKFYFITNQMSKIPINETLSTNWTNRTLQSLHEQIQHNNFIDDEVIQVSQVLQLSESEDFDRFCTQLILQFWPDKKQLTEDQKSQFKELYDKFVEKQTNKKRGKGRPAKSYKINGKLGHFFKNMKVKFLKLIKNIIILHDYPQKQKLIDKLNILKNEQPKKKKQPKLQYSKETWNQQLFKNIQFKPILEQCLKQQNYNSMFFSMKNKQKNIYLSNRIPLLINLHFGSKIYSKFKVFYHSITKTQSKIN